MKWKVLKSRYIAKDPPWFTARVDTVQLPSEEILENYYIMEYPDWVTVLAIDENGLIIMVEQYRHARGVVSLELPAGVIDEEDIEPIVAAQRELLEETGYGGGKWEYYMKLCANPGTHTNWCHTFIAKGVQKVADQKLDRTEDLSVFKVNLNELKDMLVENKIIQALHAAPLWKYLKETENE